jgi:hypothetical protein
MIDSLLEAKKITPREFRLYQLFASENGIQVFKDLQEELFWEEPEERSMREGVLGFYDGRRSILRGIKMCVEKVQHEIKRQLSEEADNDRRHDE